MRVLIIDPERRTTTSRDLSEPAGIFRLLRRHKAFGRLPNGDYVLSSRGAMNDEGFSLGGSAIVAGLGVVVGKKNEIGCYTSSRSDAEAISALVSWTSVPRKEVAPGTDNVKALLIDPEAATIEEVAIVPSRTAIDRTLGGCSRFAMKVSKHDVVFVGVGKQRQPAAWRKDGLVFRGRSLLIGADADGELKEAATALDHMRQSVEFERTGTAT